MLLNLAGNIARKLWGGYQILSKWLAYSATGFGVLMLVSIVALVFLNITSRLVVVLPLGWLVDVIIFMLVWTIFMLLGPVARKNEHIRVGFLLERLLGQKKAQECWIALESICGFIISCFFVYHGYRWIVFTYDKHQMLYSPGGFWYVLWIPRIGLPLGFFILAVIYLERVIKQLLPLIANARHKNWIPSEEKDEHGIAL
ncbi:TRAP transporter small permease [Chloroflexota bacterium]